MHKLMTILAAVLMTVSATAAPKHYELKSPDGNLVVSIEAGEGINYSLTHGQDLLLAVAVGAVLVHNVGQILIAEILQGADDGLAGGLTQTAQGSLGDGGGQLIQIHGF